MDLADIDLAIETAAKLQRRLIEAAMIHGRADRVGRLEGADILFEGLAATMGFRVERLEPSEPSFAAA